MNIKTESLNHYLTRPISDNLVDLLKADIEQNGYYDLSPLVVGQKDDRYFVLCGNHRLKAANEIGLGEMPCTVVEADEDEWLRLAIRDNEINKTLKQDDLFDWLYRIEQERAKGLTQAQIGGRVGWSRDLVGRYIMVLDGVVTQVLDFATNHQTGRVTEDVTNVTNFTEGLFRNILGLTGEQQMSLVQKLVKGKDKKGHKYNKSDFKNEAADLKKYNAMVEKGIAEIEARIHGELFDKAKQSIIYEFKKSAYLNETTDGSLGAKAMQLIQAFIDEYEKAQNIKVFVKDISCISNEDIPDNSVDAIITDPPYPKEYVDLIEDLAKLASRVLKPGGSLICLIGQSYLPKCIEYLSNHLEYYWTIGVFMPGGQAVQVWNRNVSAFWKPALWFTKGDRSKDAAWVSDAFQTNPNNNDKAHHHWGQSEQLMSELVERVTSIGDTVVDPFLGGGTTGVVCSAINRKFIGSDVSEEVVKGAIKRIHGVGDVS